jgi:hypothetical protein
VEWNYSYMPNEPLGELLLAGLTLISLAVAVSLQIADRSAGRRVVGLLVPARLSLGAIMLADRGSRRG